MGSTKEHRVLRDVLEMYKNMPYLWQKDHEDYGNKHVREEGYKVLLKLYQEFDETASMRMVKKKIENLRTHYHKEWKKVQASKQAEDKEVYVPCLWYFNILNSFLHNKSQPTKEGLGNANIKPKRENPSITTEMPKRKIRRVYTGTGTSESAKIFTNIRPKTEEPWEAYGKSIGYEVKDMKGPQLAICKKIIADAIFYGKFNKLNEHSHILNPDNGLPEYDSVEYLESD